MGENCTRVGFDFTSAIFCWHARLMKLMTGRGRSGAFTPAHWSPAKNRSFFATVSYKPMPFLNATPRR